MSPKTVIIVGILLCLSRVAPVAAAPVDIDKLHLDNNEPSWFQNWYWDKNDSGHHDPNEEFGDVRKPTWPPNQIKQATDGSCWIASGCNLLQQAGVVADGDALYRRYCLEGVNTPSGKMTWDDGGWPESVISHWKQENPTSTLVMKTHYSSDLSGGGWAFPNGVSGWEDWNPRAGAANYLNNNWQVSLGLWKLRDATHWDNDGHFVTLQTLSGTENKLTVTDSDYDKDWHNSGDVGHFLDATMGPTPAGGHIYHGWHTNYWEEDLAKYPFGVVCYVCACAVIPEPATLGPLLVAGALLLRRRAM